MTKEQRKQSNEERFGGFLVQENSTPFSGYIFFEDRNILTTLKQNDLKNT
jgi:hypothetical protein